MEMRRDAVKMRFNESKIDALDGLVVDVNVDVVVTGLLVVDRSDVVTGILVGIKKS